jgi:ADP-heptose:LPS heptosyltransferase
MASALGIPSVVVFGPTWPKRSGPRGSAPVAVLQKNPLTELTVSQVENAVSDLLEKKL